jgi:hypothetical protein
VTKKEKLAAVQTKLEAYGKAERERLQTEADWLRTVQRSLGIGAVRGLTESAAEADLRAEMDSFLSS